MSENIVKSKTMYFKMAQRRGPRRDVMLQARSGRASAAGNQQLLTQVGVASSNFLNTVNLLPLSQVNHLEAILARSIAQCGGHGQNFHPQPAFHGRQYNESSTKQHDSNRKKRLHMSLARSKEDRKRSGKGCHDQSHTVHLRRKTADVVNQRQRKLREINGLDDEAYAGIPIGNFYCHVCHTRMWGHKAFSAHVKGQAHCKEMVLLKQLYETQVKLIRHELKFPESLQAIETHQIKSLLPREYCTLCDLEYVGNSTDHRKQSSHQALQKYFHPSCRPCGKQFHAKIEWDKHSLTPEHMKNCLDGGEIKPDPSVVEMDDFDLDEKAKAEVLNANPPYAGGVSAMINHLVPKYDPGIGFSPKMVVPKEGFQCHSCMFFFEDEEIANLHFKSKTHYNKCVSHEKRKAEWAIRFHKPTKKTRHEDGAESSSANINTTSDVEVSIISSENPHTITEKTKILENSNARNEKVKEASDVEAIIASEKPDGIVEGKALENSNAKNMIAKETYDACVAVKNPITIVEEKVKVFENSTTGNERRKV